MNDQYKGAIKQNFAWWDVGGADIPHRLFTEFNEKYKAWEKRRGFATETNFIGNPLKNNENKPQPVKPLRGIALKNHLARQIKEEKLAKEAAKMAKKKGLKKSESPTNFAPPIVGKHYHSDNNAKRAIKHFIEVHYLTIPENYIFGINKIDWGVYEITGSRKQTKQPSKKNENSNQ